MDGPCSPMRKTWWLWGCFACGQVLYRDPDLPMRPNESEDVRFIRCSVCGGRETPHQLVGAVRAPVQEVIRCGA